MTSIIPRSQLKDSFFSDMPDFPATVITRGDISVDTVNGYVNTAPLPNRIYYNRRVHKQNILRVDPNTFDEVTEQEWRIPFTVDNNLPVSEITERIDKAMDKIALYTYRKINYNDYTISAYIRLQGQTT
jgi:hypothetical protein